MTLMTTMTSVTVMPLTTALTSVTIMTSLTALAINASSESCDSYARTALLLDVTVNLTHVCICNFAVPSGWCMHVVQQLHRHEWEGHPT